MNTSEMIRQALSNMPQGAVFSSVDLLSAGTRSAVDQALHRMMKAGRIVRVGRGLYVSAGQPVGAEAIATAVAKRTGEMLGLAPFEGQRDVLEVPTSGPTRTVACAGHVVRFRRMSPKKVQLAATAKGRILLDLWTRGQKNLTTIEIKRATGDWLASEVNVYAAMIPAWLRTAVQQTNSPRKSEKIGLSGAYDWSNPHMKDDVLIGKVLEKYQFEDVARLCFYYGLPKVRRVFKQRHFEPMTHASLTRMLKNISKGLRTSEVKVTF